MLAVSEIRQCIFKSNSIPMTKPILIAEDNVDDVLMLEIALKKAGIANPIHAVGDGEETMAYFAGQGVYADRRQFPLPGALFLDLRLPRHNGFEVLQWLRSRREFKDLLIIILTGARETRFIQHAYQLGANSFIIKPCNPYHIDILILHYRKCWALAEEAEAPAMDVAEGWLPEPRSNSSGEEAHHMRDFEKLAGATAYPAGLSSVANPPSARFSRLERAGLEPVEPGSSGFNQGAVAVQVKPVILNLLKHYHEISRLGWFNQIRIGAKRPG